MDGRIVVKAVVRIQSSWVFNANIEDLLGVSDQSSGLNLGKSCFAIVGPLTSGAFYTHISAENGGSYEYISQFYLFLTVNTHSRGTPYHLPPIPAQPKGG